MVKSVSQFIDEIKKVAKKYKHENFFRGHSKSSYCLQPTIYRDGLVNNEDVIFRESILRVPQDFQGLNTTVEKLVKMQHYGVPTRLLDVTTNPLVALYFVCKSNPDEHEEVVFLQVPKTHIKFYDSDTVSILSNISKRALPFEIGNFSDMSRKEFNALNSISRLHHDIKDEKPYFRKIIKASEMEEVFVVKAKLDNLRILKQNGAFLIFGINATKTMQAEVKPSWIINRQNSLDLKIPSDQKRNILDELEVLGIDESTLFPELDYQAKYLKEKYRNHPH